MIETSPDVIVIITRVTGSAPAAVGDAMRREADGRWTGTIGGGQLELALRHIGNDMAQKGQEGALGIRRRTVLGHASDQCCGGIVEGIIAAIPPTLQRLAAGEGTDVYRLDGDSGPQLCGGFDGAGLWHGMPLPAVMQDEVAQEGGSRIVEANGAEWFLHVPVPRPPLWFFGAGHVAAALAPLLLGLGFAVTVFDARREWNSSERFAPAVVRRLQSAPPMQDPLVLPSVLIATHSHRLDFALLQTLLARPTRYLGVIGSRSKTESFRHRLLRLGFDSADLSRLHMPMGVPGLGKKPLEVAVSVAAELLGRGLHKPCTR